MSQPALFPPEARSWESLRRDSDGSEYGSYCDNCRRDVMRGCVTGGHDRSIDGLCLEATPCVCCICREDDGCEQCEGEAWRQHDAIHGHAREPEHDAP